MTTRTRQAPLFWSQQSRRFRLAQATRREKIVAPPRAQQQTTSNRLCSSSKQHQEKYQQSNNHVRTALLCREPRKRAGNSARTPRLRRRRSQPFAYARRTTRRRILRPSRPLARWLGIPKPMKIEQSSDAPSREDPGATTMTH